MSTRFFNLIEIHRFHAKNVASEKRVTILRIAVIEILFCLCHLNRIVCVPQWHRHRRRCRAVLPERTTFLCFFYFSIAMQCNGLLSLSLSFHVLCACVSAVIFSTHSSMHISACEVQQVAKNSHINVFIASLWKQCLFDKWFLAENSILPFHFFYICTYVIVCVCAAGRCARVLFFFTLLNFVTIYFW